MCTPLSHMCCKVLLPRCRHTCLLSTPFPISISSLSPFFFRFLYLLLNKSFQSDLSSLYRTVHLCRWIVCVRSTCILKFSPQLYTKNRLNEHPISAVQEIQANMIQNPQFHSPLCDVCEVPRVVYSIGTLHQWILNLCVPSLLGINLDSEAAPCFLSLIVFAKDLELEWMVHMLYFSSFLLSSIHTLWTSNSSLPIVQSISSLS